MKNETLRKEYWDTLYKLDPERKHREYMKFMYNPENEGHCDECPENRDMQGNGQLPCGQYRCWVICHCSTEVNEK